MVFIIGGQAKNHQTTKVNSCQILYVGIG